MTPDVAEPELVEPEVDPQTVEYLRELPYRLTLDNRTVQMSTELWAASPAHAQIKLGLIEYATGPRNDLQRRRPAMNLKVKDGYAFEVQPIYYKDPEAVSWVYRELNDVAVQELTRAHGPGWRQMVEIETWSTAGRMTPKEFVNYMDAVYAQTRVDYEDGCRKYEFKSSIEEVAHRYAGIDLIFGGQVQTIQLSWMVDDLHPQGGYPITETFCMGEEDSIPSTLVPTFRGQAALMWFEFATGVRVSSEFGMALLVW
jgi:hypothetical protein